MKNSTILTLAKSAMFLMIGISMLFFSVNFNPAQADTLHPQNANNGRIQMHQNAFVHNNQYYYHLLVWDTNTGKSKLYVVDKKNGGLTPADYQLSALPLR